MRWQPLGNEMAATEKDIAATDVAAADVAAADVAAAKKVVGADGKKELRPRGKGFLWLMGNDNVVAGKDIQLPEKMLQLPDFFYFLFFSKRKIQRRTAQREFCLTARI